MLERIPARGLDILVIGNGAREHANLWKAAQSRHTNRLFSVPGNAGTAGLAQALTIDGEPTSQAYADLAIEHGIDLTIVGPENLLVGGIVDEFRVRHLQSSDQLRKHLGSKGQRTGPNASW